MTPTPALPLLFSPLRVGGLTLRNRIVSTAHSTGMTEGGLVGEPLLAYYEARARGGVGLIITGSTSVHPSSTSKLMPALNNWDDGVIAPYRRLAEVVHRHGAAIFAQLNHAGVQSGAARIVAPSPIETELGGETPHVLERDEIAALVAAFAAAAQRARASGLDGVELHGGHGNLIQQFLSPLTNRRDDDYGGSLANRLRFGCAVARAVRDAVGSGFVVGMRIAAEEDHPGGLTLGEMRRAAPVLVAAGALDYLNVTSGSDSTAWSLAHHYAPMYLPHRHMRHLARGIREVVAVPVIAVGRIVDAREAEAILAAGDGDLVAMTRALIADRDLPNKARRGAFNEIRHCVGINDGCLGRLMRGQPITCVQDPVSGREHTLGEPSPAAHPGRILVIGAGVAGLEAARVAALRGHRVTLVERLAEPGGQIRLAQRAPGRAELGRVAEQLLAAISRHAVELHCNSAATVETVLATAPDAVVIATGSEARLPDLPGADGRLVSARAALGGATLGEGVVVFDTKGDMVGPTTADWLAGRGHRVTLVTPHRTLGRQVEPMTWRLLYQRLVDQGVAIVTESELVRLTEGTVILRHVVSRRDSPRSGIAAVVAACGGSAEDGLYHALRRAAPDLELHLVGDAAAPREIERAIYEGHMAGRAI